MYNSWSPDRVVYTFSIPFGCLQLAVGTSPDGQVVLLFLCVRCSLSLFSLPGICKVRVYTWWKQGGAVAKLGHPAGFAGKAGCPQFCCSVLQWALCLDSLTHLNLNTLRTWECSLHADITQPTSTSSSLLVCCYELDLVCVSSSFPAWNLFPEFSLCFAPWVPLQLGSLSFSHVSLSFSLSFSFWDSIRALEEG